MADEQDNQTADDQADDKTVEAGSAETQDTKPAEAGEASGKHEDGSAEKQAEEFKVAYPDGVDADRAGKFTELFKAEGIGSEQAQKIVDAWAEQNAAADKALDAQIKAWEKEVTDLPDHEQVLATSKRAVDFVGDEDFAELVNTTWFGSHPAVVKALARFGELLGDDRQIEGNTGKGTGEKSLADRLFG